ncbi:hypothetical protein [Rivibacter subsaxonicus]|uniref:DUF4124 domain-containing protein n=1 Tax=Rivibacter subsaxonicus TaxID=457575 RepID=A0A4V2FU82_9BURK|nr:hypothetical protein [Rivibacter subsaxonicus]RZU01036.1 hypothetical protein EV670_1750 [Rivibacter subsaxonicus]
MGIIRSPLQRGVFAAREIASSRALVATICALAGQGLAMAQLQEPAAPIFSCVNAQGKRLTSDRPIPECLDREQRVLNRDGSLRQVMPASPTADERAALEEAERRKLAAAAAKRDAIRRDRNLLGRYPNEAAHQKARSAALDDVRQAAKSSESRLAELRAERKPLMDEAEFYTGRSLPLKLKRQIDAVDAALAAQEETVANQQVEVSRINALYDAELAHLRKLWAGAQPGSLAYSPAAQTAAATAAAAAAAAAAASTPPRR